MTELAHCIISVNIASHSVDIFFIASHRIAFSKHLIACTAWKVSRYGVISGLYFPVFGLNTERSYLSVFSPNTGKYGPEIIPHLDTFHAVLAISTMRWTIPMQCSIPHRNQSFDLDWKSNGWFLYGYKFFKSPFNIWRNYCIG